MKHYLYLLYFILFSGSCLVFSQSRIVINNDAYLVMNSSAYIVVGNGAASAISTTGTGGNIISEAELNRVKWNIGTNTGTYTIPFSKSPGNKIPLSVNITGAGTGAGNILFSTYGGSSWDNSTYKPGDVTNLYKAGGADNSAKVVDRFWIIENSGYTANPTADITFTYLDAEVSAAGNSITESALFAQRFNTSLSGWGDWSGSAGTANTSSNTVSSGSITSSNFFRSWTLVDQNTPLPIELINFNITCKENDMLLFEWSTSTETNNNYFTLEGRDDTNAWIYLDQVNGAGNSTSKLKYNKTISNKYGCTYFRLKQTDFDGKYTYSAVVAKNCSAGISSPAGSGVLTTYPNPSTAGENIFVKLTGLAAEEQVLVVLTNVMGQTVYSKVTLSDSHGGVIEAIDRTQQLSSGIYTVIGSTQNAIYNRKILIR